MLQSPCLFVFCGAAKIFSKGYGGTIMLVGRLDARYKGVRHDVLGEYDFSDPATMLSARRRLLAEMVIHFSYRGGLMINDTDRNAKLYAGVKRFKNLYKRKGLLKNVKKMSVEAGLAPYQQYQRHYTFNKKKLP